MIVTGNILFNLLVYYLCAGVTYTTEVRIKHLNNEFGKSKPIEIFPFGVVNSKPIPENYKEKLKGRRYLKVSIPTITPYYPELHKSTGTSIILFPSGGYHRLNIGDEIPMAFVNIGVTVFVLKYRLPNDLIMINKTIGPLQDAQRAILIIRENAKELNLDPNKIGVFGSSTGGHLASTLSTHFNEQNTFIINPMHTSLKPNFCILLYPVIHLRCNKTHTRNNLLGYGKDANPYEVYGFSNDNHVTKDTPPTFFIHSKYDTIVSIEHSKLYYNALVKYKIKTEFHIYANNKHGFGLTIPDSKDTWFNHLINWMNTNHFKTLSISENIIDSDSNMLISTAYISNITTHSRVFYHNSSVANSTIIYIFMGIIALIAFVFIYIFYLFSTKISSKDQRLQI